MVRDRMPDLRASRSNSSTFGRGFLQDVHLQIAQNKKLKDLLEEAEEIRELIHLVVENTSIVKDLQNNILSHTNRDIQKELEARTYTISQTAFRVQRKLRDLGKDITAIDDLTVASARDGPAYTRIRVLQYTTMLQLYSEIMEDYNASLLRYHDKCLLLLQQQRLLLRRQVTSEELDHMLEAQETSLFVDNSNERTCLLFISLNRLSHWTIDCDPSAVGRVSNIIKKTFIPFPRREMIRRSMLHRHRFDESFLTEKWILEDSKIARQQLSDIESRHNDVLKLEKSIAEVRDLFAEMAILIEKQGEQINNVEYFSNKTTNNIGGGHVQLKKAERKSTKYKKRRIKITIIISAVVTILLLFCFIPS